MLLIKPFVPLFSIMHFVLREGRQIYMLQSFCHPTLGLYMSQAVFHTREHLLLHAADDYTHKHPLIPQT